MSVQFGRWNFDGRPAEPEYLAKVKEMLARYGPDGCASCSDGGIDILYYPFHTTQESRQERQPYRLPSGAVLTWDGRLDNRAEFIGLLDRLSPGSPDVAIAGAAYERWGADCFRRLIGDWALAIWNPRGRCLILAKDAIGTRPLHYLAEADRITWTTILDPLVLLAGKTFALDEEYIAGWLGMFPATHLTPYVGIHSVSPASFVRLVPGSKTLEAYWDFDPAKRIRYSRDAEYEEHFRRAFRESVRRRLRSDAPVLAELSGGMDSSSIVCIADALVAEGAAEAPRLDTVSYYDDSEPNWNERPYFTKVEEKRGRAGRHINLALQRTTPLDFESGPFAAIPGVGAPSAAADELAAKLESEGSRVILSGVGGDEVTGGVPTPVPQLANLLAGAQFRELARALKLWALDKRKPWFLLLSEAARGFLPRAVAGIAKRAQPAVWLDAGFTRRNRAALLGYASRLHWFGAPPSLQENLSTLDLLRRQLHSFAAPAKPVSEKRHPYLDRDLLEFLFAIPRDQLVRPGQRRSLVRRALAGVVPDEILNRRRKGFVARAPMIAISDEWSQVFDPREPFISISLGIVSAEGIREAFENARAGRAVHIPRLMRTFALEAWLRRLVHQKILSNQPVTAEQEHAGRRSVQYRARSVP